MPSSSVAPMHLQIDCLPDLDPAALSEWKAFLLAARHQHPRQDPRFAAVERADGRDVLHLTGRDSAGTLRAVGLFSLRRHPFLPNAHAEATCLSGPVCDDAKILAAFLDGMMRLPAFARIGQVRVTPFWIGEDAAMLADALAAAGWRMSESEPFRQTGWVDLTRSPEDILGAFSKSARRELRRAERQGIVLRSLTKATEAEKFLDSLNRMRQKRGLSAIAAPGFLTAFGDMYAEGDLGVILGAFSDRAFVAGLQLYRGHFTAHGRQFTTEADRLRALSNLRIAPFLWFEGIKWAREKGCAALDVEGWRMDALPDDAKYNLYKYKSEFSPSPILRISERSQSVNRLVALTGNLQRDLRATAQQLKRRFG